jgi:AcrR family transcriptional regulator
LRLAAERPWREVTLADIAEAGTMTLADVRREFASKAQVIAAFAGMVDDEVLRRTPRRQTGDTARDRLFEVVLTRFDVLDPYRSALRSITGGGLPDPELIRPFLASQAWMLESAGIGAGGLGGGVRALGLAGIYAQVFRIWLDDDDPGRARTMAALDRRLRRAGEAMSRLDDLCKGVSRVMSGILPMCRNRGGAKGSTAPAADPPGTVAGTPT